MGVREADRFLEQWEMNARNLHRPVILAPMLRERERWHALWLLDQGWTASAKAESLGRDPHTIGRWTAALGRGRAYSLDVRTDRGSPRPWRNAAGSVEGSG